MLLTILYKSYSTFFSTNTYFNYLRKLDTTIHEKNGVGLGMNANFRGNIVSGDIIIILSLTFCAVLSFVIIFPP